MKRGKFSLSHTRLFTCDMGELIPCGLLEVLPGDSFQHTTAALVRCSPILTPIMHPVDVRIHHWYVPTRLIWSEFEDFITGGPSGTSVPAPPTRQFSNNNPAVGTLADYLGVPTGITSGGVGALCSTLPFRAYDLIWNEWYRDQDLETEVTINLGSGSDTTTSVTLQNCDWEKDYFTSARPWEQKGPSISIPLGTRANVKGLAVPSSATFASAAAGYRETGGVADPPGSNWDLAVGTSNELAVRGDNATKVPDIYADLSTATAANVNLLREAFALQRFEEARARYGSRYTEYLRYLGVRSSDARLQRPEYLGGGRNTIQFSEVLQTGGTSAGAQTGVGNLAGHGISAMRSNRYRRYFEEHGYVLTLMSIRPKTMYIQGQRRIWNRATKEDYWQKELQHIGQQELLNKEVYANHTTPTGIFGYQDRYDEYRREESWVSGDFRSLLNTWHFARSFASDPALNATFVKCVPPETPFAASTNDVMWICAKHSIQARRPVASSGDSFIF